MKRIFMFVLVGVLAAGFVFAEGQQEPEPAMTVGEPQTITVWGWPDWVGGTLDPEHMPNATEWAQDKFGIALRYVARPKGIDVVQAFNLALAQGEGADVYMLDYSVPAKILIDGLVEDGALHSLQEYFDDATNYPQLAGADRDYMMAYMSGGEIYAHPSFGWHVTKADPRQVSYIWVTRIDVAKSLGLTGVSRHPQSAEEMYETLKKIKQSGKITDYEGGALSGVFSFYPDTELNTLRSLVSQLKGAGWQVDSQMRYGPVWASEEYHKSLKELNKWWNEGLMYEGQFTVKPNDYWEMAGAKREFAVWFGGRSMVKAVPPGVPMKDDAGNFTQAYIDRLEWESGIIDPPIQEGAGKLGRLNVGFAKPVVISKDCPYPERYMKLIDWLLSDEGIITTGYWAGRLGVEWEFVEGKPYFWQAIGEEPGSHKRPDWIKDMWPNADNVEEIGKNIFVLPMLRYLAEPPYTSFTHRIMRGGTDQGTIGEFEWLSMIPLGFVREPADPRWATRYSPYVSPVPSYDLFTKELEPAEASALTTAEQRLIEQLPRVMTAGDFESAYSTFINTMISVTSWKPLYTKLQGQWEDWMELNADDTDNLQTIEWRPEIKAVMGW